MKHPQKPPCPRIALQEPSQLPAAPAPIKLQDKPNFADSCLRGAMGQPSPN